jgi:hypothetical protein
VCVSKVRVRGRDRRSLQDGVVVDVLEQGGADLGARGLGVHRINRTRHKRRLPFLLAASLMWQEDSALTMGSVCGRRSVVWFSHSAATSAAARRLRAGTRSGAPPGVLSARPSSVTAQPSPPGAAATPTVVQNRFSVASARFVAVTAGPSVAVEACPRRGAPCMIREECASGRRAAGRS